MNIRTKKVIECGDWDAFVVKTYGRPYLFQQQDGCKGRGIHSFTVPSVDTFDDEMHDSIPEVVNGEIMGVKFKNWLARDPKQPLANQKYDHQLELFWTRSFYPDFQTVANDLHTKGLLEAGDYIVNIDW